tara:strand:+ start:231 stop:509 length:279 start_codon:yes stop_codon:yes gene_type:complete
MTVTDQRKDYAVKAALIINNEEFLKDVFRRTNSLTECADLFNLYIVKRLRRHPYSIDIYGMTEISLAAFFDRVETRVPGIGRYKGVKNEFGH